MYPSDFLDTQNAYCVIAEQILCMAPGMSTTRHDYTYVTSCRDRAGVLDDRVHEEVNRDQHV